jgi:hypothetical protein
MAQVTSNIAVANAVVSVGPWVTGGGASSLVDVGHTNGPSSLQVNYNDYGLKSEQSFGILRKIPIDATVKLKVPMAETFMENLRIVYRQPAANKTGSVPNQTLLIGSFVEQYHQIQVVTKGTGATTTATRTATFWRGAVDATDELAWTKTKEQSPGPTFDILFDDTVATNDKFGKIVDSGGA